MILLRQNELSRDDLFYLAYTLTQLLSLHEASSRVDVFQGISQIFKSQYDDSAWMFAYKKREEKNIKCCVRGPWKENDIGAALSPLFYNFVADRKEGGALYTQQYKSISVRKNNNEAV